jgi:hypothetical protein
MQILLVFSLFLSAGRVPTDASRGIGQHGLGTVAEVVSWLSLVTGIGLLAPRFGARTLFEDGLRLTIDWYETTANKSGPGLSVFGATSSDMVGDAGMHRSL